MRIQQGQIGEERICEGRQFERRNLGIVNRSRRGIERRSSGASVKTVFQLLAVTKNLGEDLPAIGSPKDFLKGETWVYDRGGHCSKSSGCSFPYPDMCLS